MRKRRAVFLDRDGTINVERDEWLARPDQLRLIRGAAGAIRRLNDAGYAVVVVTNQSGVARGFLREEALDEIHAELRRRLARAGAHVDAILHCPHHPTEGRAPYRRRCRCRKPAKGMLDRAVKGQGLTLRGSWIVGDAVRDLRLAEGNELTPVLVRTGKGRRSETEARERFGRDLLVVPKLEDAVEHILARDRG
ncbi:MAG: D-glycero-beta-D-manno-heptose 1,7-bisphosphate 7-phosphatase [Planctomycetota bacterium JB042]